MEVPMEWAGAEAGEMWIQGLADALGWGMLAALLFMVPLVVLFSRAIRRRRFWCAQARRDVEVEFQEHGLPGFRWSAAVKSCSVFDPATAVACQRRCLDAQFRRQWDGPLPVRMRAGE